MKKFLALMLALVMVLSLAACGSKKDDTASDDSADATVSESTDTTASEAPAEESSSTGEYADNSLWKLLTPVTPPDYAGTTWKFTGGYIDGQQMTDEELNASLQQYGGTLEYVFNEDASKVTMNAGSGSAEGEVTKLADEAVGFTFPDNKKFSCIFTNNTQGGYTMVVITDEAGMNGLYFTLAQ